MLDILIPEIPVMTAFILLVGQICLFLFQQLSDIHIRRIQKVIAPDCLIQLRHTAVLYIPVIERKQIIIAPGKFVRIPKAILPMKRIVVVVPGAAA